MSGQLYRAEAGVRVHAVHAVHAAQISLTALAPGFAGVGGSVELAGAARRANFKVVVCAGVRPPYLV